MAQSNQESENKSKYVKAAWVKKRAAINRGEFVKMTQHPNWLEVDNGKYVPNKEAAKTVQMVFEMYASGMGSHVIAKELNNRGVKPFARAKKSTFTFSSIERLLKSEAVIGTCDVVEPPKKGYWPRVISDELWYKVQALRQQNNHYKGTRNDAQKINFLGGLAVCAKCAAKGVASKMVRYSCTGKNDQRYHYLTCSAAKYGEHSLDLVPYEAMQKSFIQEMKLGVLGPFFRAKSDPNIQDRTPELEGKLVELNKRIARVAAAIETTDNPELSERLNTLQAERKALQRELQAETVKVKGATNGLAACLELMKNVDASLEDNGFRMSLRDFLRRVVETIVVGRGEKKRPFYEVSFRDTEEVVRVEF